jgi:site-specific recombinase XerD
MRTSKTNAQNYRRALSSFYAWADRENQYPGRNPMYRVDGVKIKKQQRKAFTDMEIERLYAACRTKRETAMIAVLLSTGCRLSEVLQLKVADVDAGEVTIVGKGEKERTVYISAKAQMALEQYMSERKDGNPYVFPGMMKDGHGKPFTLMHNRTKLPTWYQHPEMVCTDAPLDSGSFGATIRNIGKRAGVEHTHPHRFRRTQATNLLRKGMPLEKVSKFLGHSKIDTTMDYIVLDDEDIAAAYKKYA